MPNKPRLGSRAGGARWARLDVRSPALRSAGLEGAAGVEITVYLSERSLVAPSFVELLKASSLVAGGSRCGGGAGALLVAI